MTFPFDLAWEPAFLLLHSMHVFQTYLPLCFVHLLSFHFCQMASVVASLFDSQLSPGCHHQTSLQWNRYAMKTHCCVRWPCRIRRLDTTKQCSAFQLRYTGIVWKMFRMGSDCTNQTQMMKKWHARTNLASSRFCSQEPCREKRRTHRRK